MSIGASELAHLGPTRRARAERRRLRARRCGGSGSTATSTCSMLPGLLYFLVFHYVPMWGVIIAFQDFRPWNGLFNSPWVGFDNFAQFFNGPYFWRLIKQHARDQRPQPALRLPGPARAGAAAQRGPPGLVQAHRPDDLLLPALRLLDRRRRPADLPLLGQRRLRQPRPGRPRPAAGARCSARAARFLPLVVGSAIWKEVGWGAIIYLAAIAGISPELYEAADGRRRQPPAARALRHAARHRSRSSSCC